MQPLPFAGRRKRRLAIALAVVLEMGLASFGLACAAQARDAADARAIDVALLADADALEDSLLARQRGSGKDLPTVAAMPQRPAALSVTLWDELARPAPTPRPVDTGGTTQWNAVTYIRR